MKKRGNSRGGEALGVAKPVSPPHTPPLRARHCATSWSVLIYRLSPVCCCIGGVWLSRFFCPTGRESGPRSGPVPCFWREQVYASDANKQEQVCYADRLPYGAYHRHRCTWSIQQHTGICQYITPYHNAEQRRARKGGARGGKTGFVTLSAFPPRKPAHAQVSH